MCEANVYWLNDDGSEELLLEDVDKVKPTENGIVLESIFSERKVVKASIKEMALVSHKILLERLAD
ncbi:MAG: CooT family nickel-binding protein [Oscillospiraceae bacterium]|jgi:predicted RNA-binding protein|nr:CooT family nickel-binding protein [Oscillospiraceae bacterium]